VHRHLEELAKLAPAAEPQRPSPPAQDAGEGRTSPPHSPHSTRVLVVDEDEVLRERAATSFRMEPEFLVRDAKTGGAAVGLALRFRPHVVVVDLRLPGLQGLRFCKAIKRSALSAETRILVLTGRATEANLRRARDSGADVCLGKPVAPDNLRYEVWRLAQEVTAAGG